MKTNLLVEVDERHFKGEEKDKQGKIHNIYRVTCNKCGQIISQTHYACCGYMASGFGSYSAHMCKSKT